MIADIVQGLVSVFQPDLFVWLLIGIPIGLIFGIIPGLSGPTLLALLPPICYRVAWLQSPDYGLCQWLNGELQKGEECS